MADCTIFHHQRVLLCSRHGCPDWRVHGSDRNRYPNAHEVSFWTSKPSFSLVSLVYFRCASIAHSSIRWAWWTGRSRKPSASVGSPICSCQRKIGSCAVKSGRGEPAFDHPSRTRAFIAVSSGLTPPGVRYPLHHLLERHLVLGGRDQLDRNRIGE